jgi:thioredoxin 1
MGENMNSTSKATQIVEVVEAHFEAEVLQVRQPVLVAFVAPWSRPCHVIDGVLIEIAAACAGRLKVVKINADDNPDLSILYDVQSIPTLLYFVEGNLRARVVGTASREAILAKLQAVADVDGSAPRDSRAQPGSP